MREIFRVRRSVSANLTLALGLVTAFLLATQSHSAIGAPLAVTARESATLTPGALYAVTTRNNLSVQYGTFRSFNTEKGEVLAIFDRALTANDDQAGTALTFTVVWRNAEARPAQAAEPTQTQSGRSLIETLQQFNLALCDIARLMFGLEGRLADSPRIAVYGEPTLQSDAKLVLERLESFDRAMKEQGFALPERTLVTLTDEAALESGLASGPIALKTAIWSPLRGRADRALKLAPIHGVKSVLVDPSVLAHERFHSVLSSHYGATAFFNRPTALALQEALADFAAAHEAGSPVIGSSSLDLRNLAQAQPSARHDLPLTRADFLPYDEHWNSLAYSGILWRLRTALGPWRMAKDFKALVDHLAETSGPQNEPRLHDPLHDPLQIENANLKHFLTRLTEFYRHDSKALAVLRGVTEANLFAFERPRAQPISPRVSRHRLAEPLEVDTGLMALATLRFFAPFAALSVAFTFALNALRKAYGLARSVSVRAQAQATP
jgi:hypothetical protein